MSAAKKKTSKKKNAGKSDAGNPDSAEAAVASEGVENEEMVCCESDIHAVMGVYDTPADAMHAAESVRDGGYRRWDVHTPFPVHGMDAAMGLKNSKVGWFSFVGGASGYTIGMLMIFWMLCRP